MVEWSTRWGSRDLYSVPENCRIVPLKRLLRGVPRRSLANGNLHVLQLAFQIRVGLYSLGYFVKTAQNAVQNISVVRVRHMIRPYFKRLLPATSNALGPIDSKQQWRFAPVNKCDDHLLSV